MEVFAFFFYFLVTQWFILMGRLKKLSQYLDA